MRNLILVLLTIFALSLIAGLFAPVNGNIVRSAVHSGEKIVVEKPYFPELFLQDGDRTITVGYDDAMHKVVAINHGSRSLISDGAALLGHSHDSGISFLYDALLWARHAGYSLVDTVLQWRLLDWGSIIAYGVAFIFASVLVITVLSYIWKISRMNEKHGGRFSFICLLALFSIFLGQFAVAPFRMKMIFFHGAFYLDWYMIALLVNIGLIFLFYVLSLSPIFGADSWKKKWSRLFNFIFYPVVMILCAVMFGIWVLFGLLALICIIYLLVFSGSYRDIEKVDFTVMEKKRIPQFSDASEVEDEEK